MSTPLTADSHSRFPGNLACCVALGLLAVLLSAPAVAAAPGITITSPANGSTVPGPDVTVTISLTDLTLVAAAQATKPTDLHVHYLLDVDPTPYLDGKTPIPTNNPAIIHSAATSATFNNVAPGRHTVAVVLTQPNHVSVTPPVAPSTTFTVGSLPRAGGAPPLALPAAAGLLCLCAGAWLSFRTRRQR